MTKVLEEINTMYNADAATLYDLKSAESSFAIAETNLFIAQQNLSIGKKSFKRIVGLEAIDLETIINIDSNLNLNEIIVEFEMPLWRYKLRRIARMF